MMELGSHPGNSSSRGMTTFGRGSGNGNRRGQEYTEGPGSSGSQKQREKDFKKERSGTNQRSDASLLKSRRERRCGDTTNAGSGGKVRPLTGMLAAGRPSQGPCAGPELSTPPPRPSRQHLCLTGRQGHSRVCFSSSDKAGPWALLTAWF